MRLFLIGSYMKNHKFDLRLCQCYHKSRAQPHFLSFICLRNLEILDNNKTLHRHPNQNPARRSFLAEAESRNDLCKISTVEPVEPSLCTSLQGQVPSLSP